MKESTVLHIFGSTMTVVGIAGIAFSLLRLLAVNPVAGVIGLVVSLMVTIYGLDEGAQADEMAKKK